MKENLWRFVALGSLAAVILLVGMGAFVLRGRPAAEPIQIVPPEATATAQPTVTPGPIVAYVSGEVAAPDVYELPPGSRIKQLVEAAGGFTPEADTAAVNLAQPINDGAHVHIPAEGEGVFAPANSASRESRGSFSCAFSTGRVSTASGSRSGSSRVRRCSRR